MTQPEPPPEHRHILATRRDTWLFRLMVTGAVLLALCCGYEIYASYTFNSW